MASTKELSDALRQLSNSTADLTFELVSGEVYFAYPALDIYVVLPRGGVPTGTLIIATGSKGGSSRKSGIRGGDSFMPGTTVMLARMKDPVELKINQAGKVFLAYIIGRAPEAPPNPEGFPPNNITGEDLDYFKQQLTDVFTSSQKIPEASQDLSHGIPTDMFSGDYAKVGALLNHVVLGAIYSAIGGSPMAKLETFGFYDKVRETADTLEVESSMSERGHYPDKDSLQTYARYAISLNEGLGAADAATAPFKINDAGKAEKAEDTQLGIFRHESLGGRIAAGYWEYLSAPAIETGILTAAKAQETARRGMLSERRFYNGVHQTRAAQEISHVKSLYIPTPAKLKTEDPAAFEKDDLPSVSYRSTVESSIGTFYDEFGAAIENAEYAWNTDNCDNGRIRARTDYWKLHTKEDIAKRYDGVDIGKDPMTLEGLDPDSFDYDAPPYVELKNTVTELTEKVYALESVIRQMPNGAVVISDGHGSEIRMSRGRLSIGCAGDMELRPGRDLIEMTPRTRVMNAGKGLYIQSAEESVFIKSDKDLKLLSGNSGKGLMLIESKATSDSDTDNTDPDAMKKGILIKSMSALSVLGVNSYYGMTPKSQDTANAGFSRNKTGSIIIDSSAGSLNISGKRGQMVFKSGCLLATDNIMLSMSGGTLGLVASSFQAAIASTLINEPDSTSVDIYELAPEGVRSVAHSISGSTPIIQIGGSLMVDSSIRCKGTISASSFRGGTGSFSNASKHYSCGGGGEGPDFNTPKTKFAASASISQSIGQDCMPETTGLSDLGSYMAGFKFPSTKQYRAEKFMMRALKWQLMLGTGGDTWTENAVSDDRGIKSYIYPGEEFWDSEGGKSGFLQGFDGEKPLSGYIINKRQ